ncbi:MAG: FkbM family methyltransferase [bacterium]|nr:FkbM family methyltransferase [bacterium]MDZ4296639.1 FkbM family methyltransferase [Patescibacteria group bacterium]
MRNLAEKVFGVPEGAWLVFRKNRRFLGLKDGLKVTLKEHWNVTGILQHTPPVVLDIESHHNVWRLRAGKKEPETVEWIEQEVRGVYYDIGACIGTYALLAALRATVVAFEPGFANYNALCKNIVLNKSNIIPLPVALGQETALVSLGYSDIHSGRASHRINERGVFNQQMMMFRLDDVISLFHLPLPDHVKIDVDGSEVSVLKGADTALRHARTVLIEVIERRERIDEVLTRYGFTLRSVHANKHGVLRNAIYSKKH